MHTQSTSLSVGFHSEAGRISHNASLQSGPVRADLCLLGRTDFDKERAAEHVVPAIRHIHHVLSGLLRLIAARVCRGIDLQTTNNVIHGITIFKMWSTPYDTFTMYLLVFVCL